MKKVASYSVSRAPDGSEVILNEGEESKTFLAFSEEFSRFVALKLYESDQFPDAKSRRLVQESAEQVRSRFSSGIAFPLEVGEAESRVYQASELLPGHSVENLVEKQGPLEASTVFELAKRLLSTTRDVIDTYELRPNLSPSQIFVWRTGGSHWSLGFADYELKPKNPDDDPGELQLVQDLSLLFYFLGAGDLQTWFYPMLNVKFSEEQHPKIAPELLYLYQRLFDADASKRPFSITDLTRLLDFSAEKVSGKPELGELAVERAFLAWMPRNGSFPEPFTPKEQSTEFGQPCTFEAIDKGKDTTSLVHILPPDSMTLSKFIDDYRQSMQLAQGKESKVLTPIESVTCDPKCRVVAEKPVAAISISTLLERKSDFRREEALLLLHKVDQCIVEVEREGFKAPSLQLNDIYIKPQGAKSRRGVLAQKKFGWLSEAEKYQVFLRPFHSNLFYGETPDLSALNGDSGKFGRTPGITNLFRPEYSFVTLAYTLMAAAMESEDQQMPKAMAEAFRKSFTAKYTDSPKERERLLDKLRRTMEAKPLEMAPEPKKSKARPVAAATAAAVASPAPAKPKPAPAKPAKPAKARPEPALGAPNRTVISRPPKPRKQLSKGLVSGLGIAALIGISAAAFFFLPGKDDDSDQGTGKIAGLKTNPVPEPPPGETIVIEMGPTPGTTPDPQPKPKPEPKPNPGTTIVAVPIKPQPPDPEPGPTAAELAAIEAARKAEEDRLAAAEAARLAAEAEAIRKKEEEERMLAALARKEAEAEAARKAAEAEAARIAEATRLKEEQERMQAEAARKAAEAEAARKKAEEERMLADAARKAAEAEAARKKEEEERMLAEAARKKAEEEKKAQMTQTIGAIRQNRESGKIGQASQQLLDAMETYVDEPGVDAELDALIAAIRENDENLEGSARDQADELLQVAALGKHRGAVSLLASRADRTEDGPSSVAWNLRAAELGDPDAMARLGIYYSVGKHVEPDGAEAVKWFQEASDLGQTEAQYYLGECYYFGKGVEADPQKAAMLLRKAHEGGEGRATGMLANLYSMGHGVEQNPETALGLYEEAITRGEIGAYGNLGVLYMQGRGVDRNPAKAFSLFKKGAEAGEANSMAFYALCFQEGLGAEKNMQTAAAWYVKAARAGHRQAIEWCEANEIDLGGNEDKEAEDSEVSEPEAESSPESEPG